MKLFNEIDDIFSREIICHSNSFECPVCGKFYKKESSIKSHFEKKDCFSYRNLFDGTIIEQELFSIFKSLKSNSYGIYNLTKFKKSKEFVFLSKLYMFTLSNKIPSIVDYINFGLNTMRASSPFIIINMLCKESSVKKYFKWRQNNTPKDESIKFILSHRDNLTEDNDFLLRSLERGDILVDDVIELLGIERFTDKFNSIESDRLQYILESVDNY